MVFTMSQSDRSRPRGLTEAGSAAGLAARPRPEAARPGRAAGRPSARRVPGIDGYVAELTDECGRGRRWEQDSEGC